jgi:RNA polymerase sigma-70 factor (TIGR02957 family)
MTDTTRGGDSRRPDAKADAKADADARSHVREFEAHRGLLFSIAYRMLGSATDAEDVVQDAWLRYSSAPPQPIRSTRAWLGTIVTRLCLDRLKAARTTRELYVGPWLPEPMLHGDREPSLSRAMEQKESISLAFLVLLEALTPHERAVFLLREVFDYDYRDIAEMLELSPVNCRQLFHRAKQRLVEQRPELGSAAARPSRAGHERFVQAFMAAVTQGDMHELQSLLHNDVVFRSDGGGKVSAAMRPVFGRDSVARLLLGIKKKVEEAAGAAGHPAESAYTMSSGTINGAPAIFVRILGAFDAAISLTAAADGIFEINLVRNPDKLAWLMRELSEDGHGQP